MNTNLLNYYCSLYLAPVWLAYHSFAYSVIWLINWFMIYVYADSQLSKAQILSAFSAVLYQFGIIAQNMTFIQSWLRPHIIKDRQTRKYLTVGLYSSRKGYDFIYISDTGSPTTCHKISSGSHLSELGIKTILLQALLVRFLLTGLSLRLPNNGCFCDIINYVSKPLAILEIHEDIIIETYVWFEILKKKSIFIRCVNRRPKIRR